MRQLQVELAQRLPQPGTPECGILQGLREKVAFAAGFLFDKKPAAQYNISSKKNKFSAWQRSSEVEQGTHKPLVTGSIPVAATFFLVLNPSGKILVAKSILCSLLNHLDRLSTQGTSLYAISKS